MSPIVFVVVNETAGVQTASVAGLAVAAFIVLARLVAGRPLRYAVSGLFGTGIAIAVSARTGRAEAYFLPGIVSGGITTVALVTSIPLRRPLVALVSWATRGWPWGWYRHDRVRPAYTTVTWVWAGFFAVRTAVQLALYRAGETTTLGVVKVVTGWPGLAALLAISYVIGRRRLEALRGPSVEEFEAQSPPPWHSQPHGF